MTAGPSTGAVGSTVGPLPSQTPGRSGNPAHLDLDLVVEDVLVGPEVGLEWCPRPPSSPRPRSRRGAGRPPSTAGKTSPEKSTARPAGMKSKISGSST